MDFTLKPAIKYITQSLLISVALTLLSNFFIKKHKNFDALVKKMDEYNAELDILNLQICSSAD